MEQLSILTVDDSAPSRRILQGVLRRMGHEPLEAKDGHEAWNIFQDSRPSVVISDWMMPRVDGLELCRRIREEDRRPYTYFVLLTALEDDEQAVRGMRAGADDYLTKPLNRGELERRLIAAARVTRLHERLAAEQEAVKRLNAELHAEARIDPLTRTGNRLLMRENLTGLAARVRRYGHKTSLLLIDIDHFKQFNDTAGHLAGDDVLQKVSGELKRQAREGDSVYRFGGEEFLVVLEEQDVRGAMIAAERIRKAIEALEIPHPSERAGPVVTVSGGVAAMSQEGNTNLEHAIHQADLALYRAKDRGRNRIEPAAGGG